MQQLSQTTIRAMFFVIGLLVLCASNPATAKNKSAQTSAAQRSGANVASEEWKAGNTALDAKDYASAIRHYTAACAGGNASGCYELGVMYSNGQGVAQSNQQAAALFGKACTGGIAPSCYNLGVMYATGEGVVQNKHQAVALFDKACAGGDATGCYNLGVMYSSGEGVAQNKQQAVAPYDKACTGGDASGCRNLGVMYANGTGVVQNYDKAIALFRKALVITPNDEITRKYLAIAEQQGK